MGTTFKLLAAVSCIAAAQISILQLQHRYADVDGARPHFDAEELPIQFNGWQGEPTELAPELVQKIGATTTVSRLYRNEDGRQAAVHLAVYPTTTPTAPHHPHECYPGAGWTLRSEDWVTENDQRRYRLMQADRDDATALVAYWYQLGERVAANHQDAREILQNLRQQRTTFPPTVKVLIQVPLEFSKDEAAKTAADLTGPIYDWIVENSQKS